MGAERHISFERVRPEVGRRSLPVRWRAMPLTGVRAALPPRARRPENLNLLQTENVGGGMNRIARMSLASSELKQSRSSVILSAPPVFPAERVSHSLAYPVPCLA
jgi:hypothetical protein